MFLIGSGSLARVTPCPMLSSAFVLIELFDVNVPNDGVVGCAVPSESLFPMMGWLVTLCQNKSPVLFLSRELQSHSSKWLSQGSKNWGYPPTV